MPIVMCQKQRIYYQIEGDHGPYLLLHPPFLANVQSWYRQEYECSFEETLDAVFAHADIDAALRSDGGKIIAFPE